MQIETLVTISQNEYQDIVRLLTQHYGHLPSPPSFEAVENTVDDHEMVVARLSDGRIVGMATLVTYRKFGRLTGHVEEDIVLLGLSDREIVRRDIFEHMATTAWGMGVKTLDLETNDDRTDDLEAYAKLGYSLRAGIVVVRRRL